MFRFLVVLFSILFISNIAEAGFAEGLKAYDEGFYVKAFEEWGKAAEEGDVAAQRNLGHLYRWGKGTDRDSAKAAYWYMKASKAGFSRAQYNLAMMYLKGEGIPKDFYEGLRWLKLSAEQDYKPAVEKVAELRADGKDVDEIKKPKTRTETAVVGFEKTDYHKDLKIEKPKKIIKTEEDKAKEVVKSEGDRIEVTNSIYTNNDFYLHIGSYNKMNSSDDDIAMISKKYNINKDNFIFKITKVNNTDYIRLYILGKKDMLMNICKEMRKNKIFCDLYDDNFKRVNN